MAVDRKLLQQALGGDQRSLEQAQNIQQMSLDSDNFGGGKAGAVGLASQLGTAAIGAYSRYKVEKTMAEKELAAQQIFASKYPQFADLASQLSPATRDAYNLEILKDSLPSHQLKTQQENLNLQKTQAEINKLNKETNSAGGRDKPPQGYEWNNDGTLTAIPGGPAGKLSAESSGKVALIKQGDNDINRFRDLIAKKDKDGNILGYDRGKIAALNTYGAPGARQERSTLYNAVNARLRLESGAAVPPSEVEAAMANFKPSTLDSDETISSKLDRMNEFFGLAKDEIGHGRGASSPKAPQNPGQNMTPVPPKGGYEVLRVRDE